MLMFSEDIADISIALVLADWLTVFRSYLCLSLRQHVLTAHYSDISIRRTQRFDILMLMLMLMSRPSSLAHELLLRLVYTAT